MRAVRREEQPRRHMQLLLLCATLAHRRRVAVSLQASRTEQGGMLGALHECIARLRTHHLPSTSLRTRCVQSLHGAATSLAALSRPRAASNPLGMHRRTAAPHRNPAPCHSRGRPDNRRSRITIEAAQALCVPTLLASPIAVCRLKPLALIAVDCFLPVCKGTLRSCVGIN